MKVSLLNLKDSAVNREEMWMAQMDKFDIMELPALYWVVLSIRRETTDMCNVHTYITVDLFETKMVHDDVRYYCWNYLINIVQSGLPRDIFYK